MNPNDPRFLKALATVSPQLVKEWETANEVGRVDIALALAGKVREVKGDDAGREAFRVLFAMATA